MGENGTCVSPVEVARDPVDSDAVRRGEFRADHRLHVAPVQIRASAQETTHNTIRKSSGKFLFLCLLSTSFV